jgi:single-strand DNA-binding protein
MANAKTNRKTNPPKEKSSQTPPQKTPAVQTPAPRHQEKEPAAPAPASQATAVADAPAIASPAATVPSPGVRLPAINDVRIAGRLTADPVIRAVGKQNVANFNVAVEKRYRDAQNQWQKQVSFVPVALWGAVADRSKDFLRKGSPVYLEGRLRSQSWETRDGQRRSIMRLEAFKVQSLAKAQMRSQGQEIGD